MLLAATLWRWSLTMLAPNGISLSIDGLLIFCCCCVVVYLGVKLECKIKYNFKCRIYSNYSKAENSIARKELENNLNGNRLFMIMKYLICSVEQIKSTWIASIWFCGYEIKWFGFIVFIWVSPEMASENACADSNWLVLFARVRHVNI